MNSNPFVCVVIVNWNRWDDTAACIRSVFNLEYSNLKVILIDNASSVEGKSIVNEFLPEIEFIQNHTNSGFASAVNIAIARAMAIGAQYIFTLNNDAVVDPTCLSILVEFAESNPSVGLVGPKIFYMDPPNRIWFAGADRDRLTFSLLNFNRGSVDHPELSKPREVTYLCAGAMLIRREVLERIGCFYPG